MIDLRPQLHIVTDPANGVTAHWSWFCLNSFTISPLVKVFRDERKLTAFRDQRKTYSISWSKKNLQHFVIKEKLVAFRDQRKTYSISWTKNIPFISLSFSNVSWILDRYICIICKFTFLIQLWSVIIWSIQSLLFVFQI